MYMHMHTGSGYKIVGAKRLHKHEDPTMIPELISEIPPLIAMGLCTRIRFHFAAWHFFSLAAAKPKKAPVWFFAAWHFCSLAATKKKTNAPGVFMLRGIAAAWQLRSKTNERAPVFFCCMAFPRTKRGAPVVLFCCVGGLRARGAGNGQQKRKHKRPSHTEPPRARCTQLSTDAGAVGVCVLPAVVRHAEYH